MKIRLGKITTTTLLILTSIASYSSTDEIKTTIHSRAFIDGALSRYNSEKTTGYFELEEFRLGFKSKFDNYVIKADISLSGTKVAIKDLYVRYNQTNSNLTVGNGYEPYSLDMISSTNALRFNQSAGSTLASTNGRRLGVTYQYFRPKYYVGVGVYSNNDLKSVSTNYVNSYALTGRFAYRDLRSTNRLLHIGVATSYRTADNSDSNRKSVSSIGITSLFGESVASTTLEDFGAEHKGMIELLSTWDKCMVQGEYYINNYKTRYDNFTTHGGYAQFAYLLIGDGFNYDQSVAAVGRPKGGRSLELVARVNYITLNDKEAQIYGGGHSDISIGANYYINKYIGVKINLGYLVSQEHSSQFYSDDLILGQVRVQYAF